jgi:hypothetical protein
MRLELMKRDLRGGTMQLICILSGFLPFCATPAEWLCFQLLQVERFCVGTTHFTRIDSP